jgi:hypothetical protein
VVDLESDGKASSLDEATALRLSLKMVSRSVHLTHNGLQEFHRTGLLKPEKPLRNSKQT